MGKYIKKTVRKEGDKPLKQRSAYRGTKEEELTKFKRDVREAHERFFQMRGIDPSTLK
jgi:hypothetical protein